MINLEKMINNRLAGGTIKCNTDAKETMTVTVAVLNEVLSFVCDAIKEQDGKIKGLEKMIEMRNI